MANYDVSVDGALHVVATEPGGEFRIDGELCHVAAEEIAPGRYRVLMDGRQFLLLGERTNGGYLILHRGRAYRVAVGSERQKLALALAKGPDGATGRIEISAPLPALVRRIEISKGDTVRPGDGLLVLEAMKMENEIRADSAGSVKEICVAEGTTVEKGQLLLVLER